MNNTEIIKTVSGDIIAPDKFTRFKDAEWFPKENTYALIGGAGGIGSWLVVLLERAGFKCIVYDFDTVEVHNLGGQLFGENTIGQPKVVAINNMVKLLTGNITTAINEIYTEDSPTSSITFSAFDNMKARKIMYYKWVDSLTSLSEEEKAKAIFMDGRLGMEYMEIFSVIGNNTESIERYKEFLFDDSEVEDAPCTMKQTSHSAAMIASHMVGIFTNHISNITLGLSGRITPFFWSFHIPLNMCSNNPD